MAQASNPNSVPRSLRASSCLTVRQYKPAQSTDAGTVDDTSRDGDTLLGPTTDGYFGLASCGADRREGPGELSTRELVEDNFIHQIEGGETDLDDEVGTYQPSDVGEIFTARREGSPLFRLISSGGGHCCHAGCADHEDFDLDDLIAQVDVPEYSAYASIG